MIIRPYVFLRALSWSKGGVGFDRLNPRALSWSKGGVGFSLKAKVACVLQPGTLQVTILL